MCFKYHALFCAVRCVRNSRRAFSNQIPLLVASDSVHDDKNKCCPLTAIAVNG